MSNQADPATLAHNQSVKKQQEVEVGFIKHYWYGILGVTVLVVFFALLIGGVIQP